MTPHLFRFAAQCTKHTRFLHSHSGASILPRDVCHFPKLHTHIAFLASRLQYRGYFNGACVLMRSGHPLSSTSFNSLAPLCLSPSSRAPRPHLGRRFSLSRNCKIPFLCILLLSFFLTVPAEYSRGRGYRLNRRHLSCVRCLPSVVHSIIDLAQLCIIAKQGYAWELAS